MASTFFGLTIAYSGLQAASTSINTTAHNISNTRTDGYSRQKAAQTAADALRTYTSAGSLGSGVVVTSIDQIRNSYYDVKYRNNQANYGEFVTKENYMTQIEDYLNEFVLKGYCTEYENFYTALEELYKTPDETSAKNQLINNAKSLADYLNTLSTNLSNIQKDTNDEVKDQVNKINTLAQNITALNKQINQIEACNGSANDLRDKRNALVDELSAIVKIDVTETDKGNGLTDYNIRVNGQTLVSGYEYNTLQTVARTEKRNASDATGLYDVEWSTGQSFDVYNPNLGGTLKALIDLRDGCNGAIESEVTDSVTGELTRETNAQVANNTSYKGVPYYLSQLNVFISTFTEAVNKVLTAGEREDGTAGLPLFTFKYDNTAMTAASVTVNEELLIKPSQLTTRYEYASGVENKDLLDDLQALAKEKFFEGGTGAYFLESIVTDMSIDSSKATLFLANYTNIQGTIQNQRLSVMGVDEDEEGLDLLKFQQSYNLCSKMMSIMNEIYNKLINETGL